MKVLSLPKKKRKLAVKEKALKKLANRAKRVVKKKKIKRK